jgi:two-component system, NarL family, invasion response regulator UvrY
MNILIADSQAKVRFGLRVWLEQQPDLAVCGEAANATELLAQIKWGCPDLILLDWELQGSTDIALLHEIKAMCPHMYVIYLSGHNELRQAALQAGADAFMDKTDSPDKLIKLIESFEGEAWNMP